MMDENLDLYFALRDLVDEFADLGDSTDNTVWRYAKMKLLQYAQYNLVCNHCGSKDIELFPDTQMGEAPGMTRTIAGFWGCHHCNNPVVEPINESVWMESK